MRRALLITCALAYGQDQTCVDDANWVKNGDEPWKDCAWVAEFIPTRCAVRGADGRDAREACPKACEECFPFAPSGAPSSVPTYGPTTAAPSDMPTEIPMRDSSIRSMGDVEGDDARPDLSGDSSGARLSLSAAAERIASSLSGGYQEYKE